MRTASNLREGASCWPGRVLKAGPRRTFVRGTAFLAMVFICLSYAPSQTQSKPALPPDREDLLNGAGMGLAAVADINNYPGPRNVLDLKNELGLTRDQVKKTEALEKVVSSSAVAKGGEIVQAEEELNQLFEAGTVSEKAVRSKLEQIGRLRADLRFIHLQAHLRMKQILTPEQIRQYTELKAGENKLEK